MWGDKYFTLASSCAYYLGEESIRLLGHDVTKLLVAVQHKGVGVLVFVGGAEVVVIE